MNEGLFARRRPGTAWLACLALWLGTWGAAHAEGVWSTDPASGCQGWNPNPAPQETVQWRGECVDGKAQGRGTFTFITPDKREENTGFYWGGHAVGRREYRTVRPDGSLIEAGAGYSGQTVLSEYYTRTDAGPKGAGGYRVRYFQGGRMTGLYQQDFTDNRERGAYGVDGDWSVAKNRFNVVYLARFNPATEYWSDAPSAADREAKGLNAYVVITRQGKEDRAQEWRCAGDAYEACVTLFEQKLAEAGYAAWPQQRMAAIDAVWAQREQQYGELARARDEHAQLLAKGTPEKLFTYASRMEQARNYAWSLDALRAILERFPKSRFFELAAQRMPAVQDRLAQEEDKQRQNEATAKRAAEQAQVQQRQAAAQQQQRDQLAAQQQAQRQSQYNACMARYESCSTDCLTSGGAALVAGIAGLASPKSVNMAGLEQLNQRAQGSCQRCESIKSECGIYAN
ncbi:MAG: hypothetical protein J7549_00945 [Variovorax sp.]|nr:hypothetical protein [Variovorax sp.]